MNHNVWKVKFVYEFYDRYYFDTWTSYENYYVQKINNFHVIYEDYDGITLNKYLCKANLYDANSSRESLSKYFDNCVLSEYSRSKYFDNCVLSEYSRSKYFDNCVLSEYSRSKYFDEWVSNVHIGSFELNDIKNKFALLCSYDGCGYKIFGYFATKDECDEEKNKIHLENIENHDDSSEYQYIDFLIINLSTLVPYISRHSSINHDNEPEFIHDHINIQLEKFSYATDLSDF
jgi:hypothetical protein